MKITYTLQDWINESNAAFGARMERATEAYHAMTNNRIDACPWPEPKPDFDLDLSAKDLTGQRALRRLDIE